MIPLLSGRPLSEFTPADFKTYVKSLFFKREPKKAPAKRLRDYSVTAKILKSGKVSVTTKRKDPSYITDAEMSQLARSLERGENEIFIAIKAKGIVLYRTHEEAEEVRALIEEIPF